MDNNTINCKVAKKCNSCQLNNLSYASQLKYKQNKVKRILGNLCEIEPIISMKCPFAYRNKAQAIFRFDKDKNLISGKYKSTTKTMVQTDNCPVETKRQNEIFLALRSLLKSFKIKPYDFYTKTGWLKSVIVREGFTSKEIMVILSGNTKDFPYKNTFISALLKKCPYITTIVTTLNEKDILQTGETTNILYGSGTISDTILNKEFIISPNSFFQINAIQTEKLYAKVIELANISKDDIVLDLYCGTGTIGIICADKAKKIISIESNQNAINDAKINKEKNNINNIDFICDDVKKSIKNISHADIAIIDPPRTGSDKDFLKSLCNLNLKKIIYVSCNIETQAKDINYIKQFDYKTEICQPIDMFPHTNHVESVVLLTKVHN